MDWDAMRVLASAQHGLLTVEQLGDLGISRSSAHAAVRRGQLVAVRRGVFALPGSPSTFRRRLMAATLAAGPDAYVGHQSALALWELRSSTARTELVLPNRRTRIEGVVAHETSIWSDADARTRHEIPVTSPARTIVDVAHRFDERRLGLLVDEAIRRGLMTVAELDETATRLSKRRKPPPGPIRAMVESRSERPPGASPAERAMVDTLLAGGLPNPVQNWVVAFGDEVCEFDAAYPAARLILEYQSYEHHLTPSALDRDAHKVLLARRHGYEVIPVTAATDMEALVTYVTERLRDAA